MTDTEIIDAEMATSTQQIFPNAPPMPPLLEFNPFSAARVLFSKQSLCQHSAEEWESRKPEITRLYIDEKLPLQEVISTMKTEHGFFGTMKQYKDRIDKWGINAKNFKASEMKAVVRKRQQRQLNDKKETGFRIRGREVESEKIEKFMKRNGIPESSQYWPTSPTTSTPSVISCYTPSARGPPTPGETLSQAATPREGIASPANFISSLESNSASSVFPYTGLSNIDELVEESFSSRDELHSHDRPEQNDFEMNDSQAEANENENAVFSKSHHARSLLHQSDLINTDRSREVTIWGVDRGYRDLDIGKNDDLNAIDRGKHHFESNAPFKSGFEMRHRNISYEAQNYYAQ